MLLLVLLGLAYHVIPYHTIRDTYLPVGMQSSLQVSSLVPRNGGSHKDVGSAAAKSALDQQQCASIGNQ